jgi:hypothetical protein
MEIETVTAFLARVEGIKAGAPTLRHGQAVHTAAAFTAFGATEEQTEFCRRDVVAGSLDPYYDDSRVDAFLAAAVAAGVLREDHA